MEEIINSGVLMDYCLGLVTEMERKKVEQLCKDHPAIAAELKLLQEGLESYVVKKTTWKKEGVKQKIWEAIDKINKGKREP